jgi:hypothetical protein
MDRSFAYAHRVVRVSLAAAVAAVLLFPAVAAAQDPPASPPPAPAQMPPSSSRVFNPDTSVIANFLGITGKNPRNTSPTFQLTEVEVSLQAVVDPYSRADFFLAAGPEGLEVEEGYITFTTLPGKFQLKVGKMRAQFGKVNTLHTHSLPYADRPLMSENLAGGEEGLSDAGLSLSRLFASEALFLEATGEVFAGTSGLFQSSERKKLNYVGRLRAYRDLTEGTNIDLGGSVAYGPTDLASDFSRDANKTLFGIDATFRYRPLRRAIYRRFQARTELVWSRQDLTALRLPEERAFGWYGLAEYQFARRWYAGGRYDRSGQTLDAASVDTGQSFFLTFWPSEFSQVRGQFRHTKYADGVSGKEFLFQFNFSIGAHGAHIF